MKLNLTTITKFSAKSDFSEGQLRWMVFNPATNGMDDSRVVYRIGRRVYLDEDAFYVWAQTQNGYAPREEASGGARVA